MPLSTGQTLQNRYRIVSLLGQGGMGAVYRAWHLGLEMPVAIKEMVPQPGLDSGSLDKLREQFKQEAAVLARLRHPHLVLVTDYFIENGNTYLVMDHIEGESLADRIERLGPLSEADVLRIAADLLEALAYCHDRGVIHRDVKPQNVILRPGGDAVLVDFGLLKLWDPNDPLTRTAIRGAGTPEYAPPEQYGGHAEHTGPHSDIYSLGATLYHALTGIAPPTVTERVMDPANLRSPSALRKDVSDRTATALLRAMELQPQQRFAGATEMARALRPESSAPCLPGTSPAERAGSAVSETSAPLAGPAPRSGTKAMPPDALPSPDRGERPRGLKIAFWSIAGVLAAIGLLALGGNVVSGLIEPTATPTVTPEPTPAATPTAEDPVAVWRASIAGYLEEVMPGYAIQEWAWAPDGRTVLYPVHDPEGRFDTWIWRYGDPNPELLLEGGYNAQFVPSGEGFYFQKSFGLWYYDLDGGSAAEALNADVNMIFVSTDRNRIYFYNFSDPVETESGGEKASTHVLLIGSTDSRRIPDGTDYTFYGQDEYPWSVHNGSANY